jgi:hypothetical protein
MRDQKRPGCMEANQITQSKKAGVPPYNWVPKPWDNDQPTLEDTVSAEVADCIDKNWKKYCPAPLKDGCEDYPGKDQPAEIQPGKKHGFSRYVHPDSDFSHIDPDPLDSKAMRRARAWLPKKQYQRLGRIVGRESLGMQRLACVFQWIEEQAYELLSEINNALGVGPKKTKPDRGRYNKARDAYLAFLNDLDEHEPRVRGREIIPGKIGQSGYGQTIKWAYVFPAIHQGKIYGAKIVIMWNPHSSSNGIPLPHSR